MNTLKKLYIFAALSTVTLFAGFTTVDCNNTAHLSTLNITQGDCQALESFWDATGQGAGWTSQTDANTTNDWDRLDTAENWYGITLHPEGGVKWLNPQNNNIIGQLPEGLRYFTTIQTVAAQGNHLSGSIPSVLNDINSLTSIAFSFNNYTGSLPKNITKTNLVYLRLDGNHYTGSIPTEYGNLTKLKDLFLEQNQLSGPLPDLSKLTALVDFRIDTNLFTFADMEPQIEFIKNVAHTSYGEQADINETGHIVYFSDTLSIEPRLAANPSKHDYYIWKKDNTIIEDTRVYANEDYSASRIYTKTSATQADEGCYSYDVNNSRASRLNDGRIEFILHSNTCIQAIFDHAPVLSTPNPSLTATEGVAYTYDSNISDADNDDFTVTTLPLPAWLTFSADASGFALSGTPSYTDAGSYDINITVTDGKVPVYVNYVLTVQENIPAGYSIGNNTYIHTATGTSIGVGSPYYYSFPEVDDSDNIELYTANNSNWRHVYEGLTPDGILTTGYFNNTKGTNKTPTLATPYPLGSKATLLEEPNSAEHQPMIMVEIPLTSSITIGD